jgi:hypothetical protein
LSPIANKIERLSVRPVFKRGRAKKIATTTRPTSIIGSTENAMSANMIQFHRIVRCHRRLCRLGRQISLDQTARIWISRYAAGWRKHNEHRIV